MTRIAILSDIHGNLPALEAVLDDIAQTKLKIDHTIVAGDVVNWGPFSAQVMQRVVSEGWAVIRGNNEFYVLDYSTPRAPAEWSDTAYWPLLPWLKEQLTGRWETVIAAWPDSLSLRFPDAPPVYICHGAPGNPWQSIFPRITHAEAERVLAGAPETTVIAGHTHLAMDRFVGLWHILNPGSVGVPLDGTRAAGYIILDGNADGWRGEFRRVPYTLERVLEEFERQRFAERTGVIGKLVLQEFELARLRVHPFLRWQREQCPDAPLTPELLEEFDTVDPWPYTPAPYHTNVIARQRATAVMLRGEQILLVRMQVRGHAWWGLPGGTLEEGETPEEAVAREMREELGLTVQPIRRLYEAHFRSFKGKDHGILVTPDEREPTLGGDMAVVDWRWFNLAEVDDWQLRRVKQALAV